jgi:hypothetical protein
LIGIDERDEMFGIRVLIFPDFCLFEGLILDDDFKRIFVGIRFGICEINLVGVFNDDELIGFSSTTTIGSFFGIS